MIMICGSEAQDWERLGSSLQDLVKCSLVLLTLGHSWLGGRLPPSSNGNKGVLLCKESMSERAKLMKWNRSRTAKHMLRKYGTCIVWWRDTLIYWVDLYFMRFAACDTITIILIVVVRSKLYPITLPIAASMEALLLWSVSSIVINSHYAIMFSD